MFSLSALTTAVLLYHRMAMWSVLRSDVPFSPALAHRRWKESAAPLVGVSMEAFIKRGLANL